jgi:hypothetical protein
VRNTEDIAESSLCPRLCATQGDKHWYDRGSLCQGGCLSFEVTGLFVKGWWTVEATVGRTSSVDTRTSREPVTTGKNRGQGGEMPLSPQEKAVGWVGM